MSVIYETGRLEEAVLERGEIYPTLVVILFFTFRLLVAIGANCNTECVGSGKDVSH